MQGQAACSALLGRAGVSENDREETGFGAGDVKETGWAFLAFSSKEGSLWGRDVLGKGDASSLGTRTRGDVFCLEGVEGTWFCNES